MSLERPVIFPFLISLRVSQHPKQLFFEHPVLFLQQNIRLGPSLPAYVTPNVLNVLVDNYNIMPTGSYEDDIAAIMEGK